MPDKKECAWPQKEKVRFNGVEIVVENPAGTKRCGKSEDGTPWETTMMYSYGYIKGTEGADGEEVDVYLGPNEKAPYAFIVHQNDPDKDQYDEDKVMLGFESARDAKEAYLLHYDDKKFFGEMSAVPWNSFKRGLGLTDPKRTAGFSWKALQMRLTSESRTIVLE
jgi:hypothetical protein